MNKPGRNIPRPVKRAVRQRCGFGCVVCGVPLYEYEHMEGWATVQRHIAEEITLLCDRHHSERTRGLLPVEAVRDANRSPFNLRAGVTPPYDLHYSGNTAEAAVGGNDFAVTFLNGEQVLAPVIVDGQPLVLFRLEDGHLLLSLYAYDVYNNPVLVIEDNELRFAVNQAWDYELQGRSLVIRMGPKRIFLDVEFAVPNKVIIKRGTFLRNGVWIEVSDYGIGVMNTTAWFSNNGFEGANAGIIIGVAPPGLSAVYHNLRVPRYALEPASPAPPAA